MFGMYRMNRVNSTVSTKQNIAIDANDYSHFIYISLTLIIKYSKIGEVCNFLLFLVHECQPIVTCVLSTALNVLQRRLKLLHLGISKLCIFFLILFIRFRLFFWAIFLFCCYCSCICCYLFCLITTLVYDFEMNYIFACMSRRQCAPFVPFVNNVLDHWLPNWYIWRIVDVIYFTDLRVD